MSIPANIFELLQDENDSEVKKAPTSAREQPKKGPTTAQPAKTQQKAVTSGEKGAARPKSDQPRRPQQQQQREGSGAPAQFQEERRNRPPRQQGGEGRERREKQAERSENPKHRTFDRRSGTGRGKETKRGGAGKANWGTQEDDQKAQVEAPTEQTTTEENAEQQPSTEAKPEATAEPVAEPNPEDEEDAKLKTLDDYRKSLKTPVLSLPPPRVVEDKGEWSKYTALKRDEDAPQKKATKKEDKDEKEEKEDSSKKIRADEVLKFTEGSPKDRRGGFRGGRGGANSPRGGRGGKRGGSTRSSAPNFSDERSFPSLSTATKA